MTNVSIPPLISSAIFLFLGFLVYFNGGRSKVSRSFLFLCLFTFWWQFSWFILFNSTNWHWAEILVRIGYAGIIFIPFAFFSFCVYFFRDVTKLDLWLARHFYIFPAIFIFFLGTTDYFINGFYHYSWGFYPKANFLHLIFIIALSVLTVRLIYLAFWHFRRYAADANYYKQVRMLLFATLFYVFSSTDFLVNYGISFYPLGFIFIIIFSVIITYSIVLYGMMNVKLVLRRSLVYFFSFISILAPAFIWQYFFYSFLPQYTMLSYVLIFVFSLSVFSRLKRYYFRISNKYFFSSLYDIHDLVSDLNSALRSSLDMSRIFSSVSQILIRSFRTKAIGIVSYNQRRGLWNILYNNGFVFDGRPEISLNYEVLQIIFKDHNKPQIVGEIKEGPWRQFFSMVKFFDQMNVTVIVPIAIKDRLHSLMFLGPKESGDSYNNEDLKVLGAISTEVAISMENAALYQRTRQFNIELKEKINQATKQLQEQNIELQKVNKIKNDFISVTSHQLKTPLATTKLNLEVFGLKFKKKLLPEANEMLDNLTNTNNQLIKLVEELLDVARIEDSRLKIEIEPLDVPTMVAATVSEFKPLADKRGITILEQHDSVPTIDFDRSILSKAIANLISNGIKYNRDRKNLVINIKKSDLGVLLSVADEGIGIPQAEQSKIFQKFYQATNAAKANFESSTGLGMYITKSSVEQLGGRVWFESQEGVGSTFFIDLPLKAVTKQ